MAAVTRWALFWRAFFLTLIFGAAAGHADTEDETAWAAALSANTPEAFYLYLSRFPAGAYVEEAVRALADLGAIAGARGVGTPGGGPQPAPSRPAQDRGSNDTSEPPPSGGGLYP